MAALTVVYHGGAEPSTRLGATVVTDPTDTDNLRLPTSPCITLYSYSPLIHTYIFSSDSVLVCAYCLTSRLSLCILYCPASMSVCALYVCVLKYIRQSVDPPTTVSVYSNILTSKCHSNQGCGVCVSRWYFCDVSQSTQSRCQCGQRQPPSLVVSSPRWSSELFTWSSLSAGDRGKELVDLGVVLGDPLCIGRSADLASFPEVRIWRHRLHQCHLFLFC